MDELNLVKSYYGDKTAKRSGVPLINHIMEGIQILDMIGADQYSKRSYAIHPLFQDDSALVENYHIIPTLNPIVVALVMEYRNTANRHLSKIVEVDWTDITSPILSLSSPIQISPLVQVNEMLIADKVQNYKDFLIHHKSTHPRSIELDFYFKSWLEALSVDNFETLCSKLAN